MDAKEVIKIGKKYKVVTKGLRPKHSVCNGSHVTIMALDDDPKFGLCADVTIYGSGGFRQWVNTKELEHI